MSKQLPPSQQSEQREAQRINLCTAIADGALSLLKLVIGGLTFSNALVADGIHSLADLFTDLIVYVATHFGRRAPDEDHPYGHGRIETMASLWLGVVLSVVAGALIWESAQKLWQHDLPASASGWAIVATLIALLAKEGLFQWTIRIARRQQSSLLKASAWHSRSDSASSLIVLVGLLGTRMGWTWLDPTAALLVALLVAKIGFDTLWEAGRELIDTTLPEDELQGLHDAAQNVDEVIGVHDLRARRVGNDISLDIHLQVANTLSVSEAHEIGMAATRALRQKQPLARDITFHIDYEDDTDPKLRAQTPALPLREEIIAALDQCWKQEQCWQQRQDVVLHYRRLSGGPKRCIDIDIHLPGPVSDVSQPRLKQLADTLPWLGEIQLWQPLP